MKAIVTGTSDVLDEPQESCPVNTTGSSHKTGKHVGGKGDVWARTVGKEETGSHHRTKLVRDGAHEKQFFSSRRFKRRQQETGVSRRGRRFAEDHFSTQHDLISVGRLRKLKSTSAQVVVDGDTHETDDWIASSNRVVLTKLGNDEAGLLVEREDPDVVHVDREEADQNTSVELEVDARLAARANKAAGNHRAVQVLVEEATRVLEAVERLAKLEDLPGKHAKLGRELRRTNRVDRGGQVRDAECSSDVEHVNTPTKAQGLSAEEAKAGEDKGRGEGQTVVIVKITTLEVAASSNTNLTLEKLSFGIALNLANRLESDGGGAGRKIGDVPSLESLQGGDLNTERLAPLVGAVRREDLGKRRRADDVGRRVVTGSVGEVDLWPMTILRLRVVVPRSLVGRWLEKIRLATNTARACCEAGRRCRIVAGSGSGDDSGEKVEGPAGTRNRKLRQEQIVCTRTWGSRFKRGRER